MQQTTGYRLRLTQAGANYVNRALRKKALKRFSQFGTLDVRIIRPAAATPQPGVPSTPGGGTPGRGDTPGGSVTINPGLLDLIPGGGAVTPLIPAGGVDLDGGGDPDLTVLPLEGVDVDLDSETGTIRLGGGIVLDLPGLGIHVELVNPEIVLGTDAGLYAHVNGVRVKVGDIDTNALDINVLDGTVTIKQLHVNLGGGMLGDLLAPVLGALGIPANTPILNLDLSFPDL